MVIKELAKLAALIRREREGLLASWRRQVRELPSAQDLDTLTLDDHVPQLILEMAAALEAGSDETIPEALSEGTPPAHGSQRVKDGYDIEEMVAEYNILRGCIHDLAEENGLTLQGKPFHILNRVLDGAIGLAVQTFAAERALEVRQRRDEHLAFVAHDLRTPLHAISLATSVLERTLPPQGNGKEYAQMFKTLRRNVQHLDKLVGKVIEENTGLLSASGIKVERREFDLWPLVEYLIKDLDPVAQPARTRLINKVPDDMEVFADASLLRRIFQNLVANAIRYTPGGEVVIQAKPGAEGALECSVSDNGAGIAPEHLQKVFEKSETDPAKTDPPKEEGSGLGLSIVKTFVEAHGGKISVESRKGLGTTFRFTLPPKTKIEAPAAS